MTLSISVDPEKTNETNNLMNGNISSLFNFKSHENNNVNNNVNNNNVNNNIENNKFKNLKDSIELINSNHKKGVPIALTIFHPMCGHCHTMRPEWEHAGREMENEFKKNLIIGLVHKDYMDKLPIKKENVQGFPHIVFISKKGEKEYNGMRNVNAFKNWMKQNVNENMRINNNTKQTKKNKKKSKRIRIRIHKGKKKSAKKKKSRKRKVEKEK
jgi:hypothetical protein